MRSGPGRRTPERESKAGVCSLLAVLTHRRLSCLMGKAKRALGVGLLGAGPDVPPLFQSQRRGPALLCCCGESSALR